MYEGAVHEWMGCTVGWQEAWLYRKYGRCIACEGLELLQSGLARSQISWNANAMPCPLRLECSSYHTLIAGFALPAAGVCGLLSFTVSLVLLLMAGRANLWLLPTLPAFQAPTLRPKKLSFHMSAPTHGCTFHPTCSVTLLLSPISPFGSVIWYFGFWFFKFSTPGLLISFVFVLGLGGVFLRW